MIWHIFVKVGCCRLCRALTYGGMHLVQQVSSGHSEALQVWFEAPPPIDHPYQVMQGVIEWRKVKDRLAGMGVRSARDDRQLLQSVRGLLGGNYKTKAILKHLGDHLWYQVKVGSSD